MVTLWAVPSFSSQSIPRKANNIFDGRLESMEEYIGNSPLTLSRSTAAHFWYAVFLKSEPDAPRGRTVLGSAWPSACCASTEESGCVAHDTSSPLSRRVWPSRNSHKKWYGSSVISCVFFDRLWQAPNLFSQNAADFHYRGLFFFGSSWHTPNLFSQNAADFHYRGLFFFGSSWHNNRV